jgi:phosphoglycerate kinase
MQTNYNYKTIKDAGPLRGKRVLLRLDLNVPVAGDEIRDDFRIKQSLPTIKLLTEAGAKVIILSHLENADTASLERVASYVNDFYKLSFVKNIEELKLAIPVMKDGGIVMLENLRLYSGEKTNDTEFCRTLASLADIYVNDAFSVSHRSHASVVGLPRFLPAFAGPLFDTEVRELSTAFNPPHPFLFILGGAKFDTKLPLIDKFLGIADSVFIGGALANDIFKEKGFEVGLSVVSKTPVNMNVIIHNPKLIIPKDVVVANSLGSRTTHPDMSPSPDEKILDAGSETIASLSDLLTETKFVLWNGPLGDYEHGFAQGTEDLARAIAESGVRSIVGGGDTVAVLRNLGILDKFSFVSTGGGAMLDFLAQGTLPGIEALRN